MANGTYPGGGGPIGGALTELAKLFTQLAGTPIGGGGGGPIGGGGGGPIGGGSAPEAILKKIADEFRKLAEIIEGRRQAEEHEKK